MIDHLELQTRQMSAALGFYSDALAPLGYRLKLDGPVKGFGSGETMDLFLVEGVPSRDVHFAFAAESRASVDAAWNAARAAGHTLDRPPALAPHIHANYYAGYLRDPDGRLVELVCQRSV